MSVVLLIIILLICLLLEGFFSGSEMALVNADKYRLAIDTDAGSKRALSAMHLIKRPAFFFSTTLLGTNICVVAASVSATFFIIDKFGESYAPLAILWLPFTLIFGEIVPKSIYHHSSDAIARRVAPILLGVSFIMFPLVWLLSKLTESLLGGMKRRSGASPPVSREALEAMIESSSTSVGDVHPNERTMISRIFNLADKKVENIMTPLVDVVSIPITTSGEEAMRVLEEYEFSRIPVYEWRAYNIVGVLTWTDLLFEGKVTSIKDVVGSPYYVPEEMPLDELLIAMKRKGEALAVAVDEYGGATGIVTIEDLIEEVVGEIRDEHDEKPLLYQRVDKNRFLVSGRLEVEHANERLNLGIPKGDYETIAGFVIKQMGRIPKEGDVLKFGGFVYAICRATDRAILELEITREY